ncbi:thioredoxin family protein [Candidatus Parcubacteria bacterium]|jgi:thiol-disulfide isomerase/thioredoxin|nr:thioredoxin family protein [Candidatus Parcubacteria bacterium]
MKVLKFGAVWCLGCLIMKPRWTEIETENTWLETEYYDFDESLEKVKEYKIDDKLPVFVFLDKDNKEFLRLQGEVDKKEIIDILVKNKNQ